MATVICPRCGTANPDTATNCENCRINLKFALEHPEAITPTKQEVIQGEQEPASTLMTGYVNCPRCGSSDIKKVTYTWWGGAVGPRLLNHVKCNSCGMAYNGKTGQSNTTAIVIYSVVALAIALALCVVFGYITGILGGY